VIVAVVGAIAAAGSAATGIASTGGQVLALVAGLLALAALGLGFVGLTSARVRGTSRLPGVTAMVIGVAIFAGLIAAAGTS
jgi:hypothetical protein